MRDTGLDIGVTVSGVPQPELVRQAIEIQRGGKPLFASVQATWNLIEPSCGDALREAHAAGRHVIVKEPLANGRLTDRGLSTLPRGGEMLAQMATSLGVSADVVALAGVLAQPWAGRILIGAATPEHLRSNLRALEVKFSDAQIAALEASRVKPGVYWTERSKLPWN